MNNPISRDVFDSRDLIEYREHLEEEFLDSYNEMMLDLDENFEEISDIDEVDQSMLDANMQEYSNLGYDFEEYESIRDFCSELDNCTSEFVHGEGIIHEDYFEEYCEQFLKDCGYISDDLPAIISNNIDFEGIANDMEQDYSRVTYQGDDYLIRSY